MAEPSEAARHADDEIRAELALDALHGTTTRLAPIIQRAIDAARAEWERARVPTPFGKHLCEEHGAQASGLTFLEFSTREEEGGCAWCNADERDRDRAALRKAEPILSAAARSRCGSVGSIDSHYVAQLRVEDVDAALAAVRARLGEENA